MVLEQLMHYPILGLEIAMWGVLATEAFDKLVVQSYRGHLLNEYGRNVKTDSHIEYLDANAPEDDVQPNRLERTCYKE